MDNHDFMEAMRNCIKPQIDLKTMAKKECACCKLTKDIEINRSNSFEFEVYDFLSLCDKNEIPTSFDYVIDNSAIFKKEDEEFSDDWYLSHEAGPTSRLLCAKCNLECNATHIIIT